MVVRISIGSDNSRVEFVGRIGHIHTSPRRSCDSRRVQTDATITTAPENISRTWIVNAFYACEIAVLVEGFGRSDGVTAVDATGVEDVELSVGAGEGERSSVEAMSTRTVASVKIVPIKAQLTGTTLPPKIYLTSSNGHISTQRSILATKLLTIASFFIEVTRHNETGIAQTARCRLAGTAEDVYVVEGR